MTRPKRPSVRKDRSHPLFLGDPLAIVAGGEAGSGTAPARPLLIAAWSGNKGRLISVEQLGEFLAAHAKAKIFCHDAASLHWLLFAALSDLGDRQGLEELWRVSAECRLIDAMLLEQSLREVCEGVFSPPKSFAKLGPDSTMRVAVSDGNDLSLRTKELHQRFGTPTASDDQSRRNAGIELAQCVFFVGDALYDEATRVTERLQISPLTIGRYGPLGQGIDVQGAIALRRANQLGLALPRENAVAAIEAVERRYAEASAILKGDRHGSKCFKWEEATGTVKRDCNGFPETTSRLQSWLNYWQAALCDLQGVPVLPPIIGTGEVSPWPRHWGSHRFQQEKLRAWADLTDAAENARAFKIAMEAETCHPEYEVLPQLCAKGPCFELMRNLGLSVFRPRQGHVFLVLATRDLELRCLAAILRRQASGGLREKLEAGEDAFELIAAALVDSGLIAAAARCGRLEDQSLHQRAADFADSIVLSLIHGLPAAVTAALLNMRGYLDVAQTDVPKMCQRVLAIFPEMALLSHEPEMRELADKLAVPKDKLLDSVFKRFDSRSLAEELSKLLGGAWRGADLAAADNWQALDWPIGEAGSVGRVVYATQRLRQSCVQTANEIRKTLAYALVRRKLRLVGINGPEIVLEIPDDVNLLAATEFALGTASQSALPFIGALADKCCTSHVQGSW